MAPRPGDRPPAAVLFDLDDTLCDYATARANRLRIAFSHAIHHGKPVAAVDLDRLIEESIAMHPHGVDHFGSLFASHGVVGPEAARLAAQWYQENRFHGLRLFPEAVDVVQAVRRRVATAGGGSEHPIGIVTNGPAEVQRAKIELLGVEDFVDFAVVSGEFGAEKPDPAIFAEALRLAGVSPEDALFVGDSLEHDVAGAHGAGIRSVWVNRRRVAVPEGAQGPTYEIVTLDQLPGLMDRLVLA
jgi:FMN hydrolase / 5-amino-6-(5-phospho-D-ribitylamino)uracil phosphatase